MHENKIDYSSLRTGSAPEIKHRETVNHAPAGMVERLRKLTTTRPEWQKGIDIMSETNKPSTRDLFAEWAGAMFGDNGQSDEPAKEAPEPENRPSPMGDAENYSPTPTRDLFAMTANEALSNGFNDDSGLWRRII